MYNPILPSIGVIILSCTGVIAQAQSSKGSSADEDSTKTWSKSFDFINNSLAPAEQKQVFCLPSGIKLLSIDVKSRVSNDKLTVKGEGNTSTNCITLDVLLPPAKQVCASIPTPTWSEPLRTKQDCYNGGPTILGIDVEYKASVEKVVMGTGALNDVINQNVTTTITK